MTTLLLIYGLLIMLNACVTRGASHGDINGKWKLTAYSFTPKQEFPIETMTIDLTITDNKQIGGKSGCNFFGGDLTVLPGHKVKVGPLVSTDRACDEMTGRFESLFTGTLQNSIEYSLENGVLTFFESKANFLRFERVRDNEPVGQPTTEERVTWFVENRLVNCTTAAVEKCLRIKTDKNSAWHIFSDPIIGFDFKPGRFYKIEVIREKAANEPGKPSFYRYKLARVIKSVRTERGIYR